MVFCSVKEALEVDWSSDKAKAALKRTTSDYFLLQGEASHQRFPVAPCALISADVAAESKMFLEVCPESSSSLAGSQQPPKNRVNGGS